MSSTRTAKKAETRIRLKEAGRAAFAAHGVDGTTIRAITRAAGTAQGTFYVHFEDKDELVRELVSDLNAALVARLEPVWREHGTRDLPGLVAATAELFCDHWLEHTELVGAAAQHLASQVPLQAAKDGFNPEANALMAPWLTELEGRGGMPPSRIIGPALLALWARIGLQLLFSDDVSRADAIHTLTYLTVGALRLDA